MTERDDDGMPYVTVLGFVLSIIAAIGIVVLVWLSTVFYLVTFS